MDNVWIGRALEDVASLLQLQEANPFRVRAYTKAARTVREHDAPLQQLFSDGFDLTELPNVGKEMARHIETLVREGETQLFRELAFDVPLSLLEITRLPGIGAKRTKTLWRQLDLTTVDDLEAAANAGSVAGLPGFGEKTQQKILESIRQHRLHQEQTTLGEADLVVPAFLNYLRDEPGVLRIDVAGSYRRRREVVSEVDVLIVSSDPATVVESCRRCPDAFGVESPDERTCTLTLRGGVRVIVHFTSSEDSAVSLVLFTGSEKHTARMQERAVELGLLQAEEGLGHLTASRRSDGPEAAESQTGVEERDVYEALGLPWIPPELREDRGEIAAAAAGELPALLTLGDMRGDLHMHSTWSDGRASIEDMLAGCVSRGYEYFAITDHSKALAMAGGLDAKKLRRQWLEIDEIAARHPEIRILRSMEVDILGGGQLDLEDELLAELDLVLVAIHSRFNLPHAEQTERILTALQHPEVNILVHPTGRLLNRRGPLQFDLDAVLECAAERGIAVELNAHPDRLDLSDVHLMEARSRSVKVVISTDAHNVPSLELMPYGVSQARRAWLEKGNVLNTLPCDEMLAALHHKPTGTLD